MKEEFWLDVWRNNDIGFDQKTANPLLVKHMIVLNLSVGDCVFVPLCGKSIDMIWLLKQGYKVIGVELSEDAIEQLFDALKVKPRICSDRSFKRYSAYNIEILVGDFFALTDDILGPVDAIYDRACLVALPLDMRTRYVRHIKQICASTPQLLVTFDYDQKQQAGPPFSITEDEVNNHYARSHQVALLEQVEVEGGLKGGCQAVEQIWLIK